MTTHDRCPECGIGDFIRQHPTGHADYTCGNHRVQILEETKHHPGYEHSGYEQADGIDCLRNQLANIAKEWEAHMGIRSDMIRRLREAAGLTQEKLAEAVGVSPRAIRKIEAGHTCNPTARTMTAMARALGVEIGELVG